jgi:formylglycine-generating enzyme required for sulfatase activity
MKKVSIFACIICLLLCSFPLLLHAEQQHSFLVIKDNSGQSICYYEASHALLIGISEYTNGWPVLQSVPGEIGEVEEVLNQHGFYVSKYLNLNARELEEAFKVFINYNGFDKDNRLLIFFSGHGYTRDEKGYLVPADAPDPRLDERGFLRKALSMDQILTWARQIEAKHVLFVFDSCFSGTIFQTRSLPEYPPPLSQTTALPVRQFITGGGVEDELPSKSVFAPAFVDALRFGWGDLNQDGYVTGMELGLYLRNKVPVYADQTPQFARINDYDLAHGDFVFVAGLGQQTAILTILSNVHDDTVFIDGEIYGSTRVERELSIGLHTVRVESEGYIPFESTLNLQHSQALYVTLEPLSAIAQSQPVATSFQYSDRWIEPITGMEFVWIPGGCYSMGCVSGNSDCDIDEKPVHEVCVGDFWMGKYEVTQAQWQQIMGDNPSHFSGFPDYPVENISYDDAQTFISALNRKEGTDTYRLPTEAEWEYAARAGSNRAYCFGNDTGRLKQYAWYGDNSGNTSHSVGQLKPNVYRLHDMHGNVWEWCQDRYDRTYYFNSPSDNPRGPLSGLDRVARGGSWGYDAKYCRSSYRFHHPPYSRNPDLGFRLVRRPE